MRIERVKVKVKLEVKEKEGRQMLILVHGQLVLLIEYHKIQGRDLFLRDISSSHSKNLGFHCTFVCLPLELCIEISKTGRRKTFFGATAAKLNDVECQISQSKKENFNGIFLLHTHHICFYIE